MRFNLALAASLASGALAVPWGKGGGGNGKCLSQSEAETLVNEYAAVIAQQPSDLGSAADTAAAIAAAGYQEQSDSANTQLGIPLGAITVPSKQVFIQSSQSNPPVVSQTLGVFVACNYITWQWIYPDFGSGALEVKGFHLFEVNANGKLVMTYFEFNSIAGAIDTGWSVFLPNGTQYTG